MKLLTKGLLAVAAVFAATTADATTYIGLRSVGAESVSLSITTDGTLGVLGAANITSWSVVIADPDPTRSFNNFTLTPGNSALRLLGDALSATPTSLLFDFGSAGSDNLEFYQVPIIDGAEHLYCVDTNGACTAMPPGSEAVSDLAHASNFVAVSRSGVVVLGAVPVAGGVPEPTTWALLICGFGGVGARLRRRPVKLTA